MAANREREGRRMMRTLFAAVFLLCGCSEKIIDPSGPNQCMRAQLFKDCMAELPAGPTSTHYNDWDEVVKACENAAYYQSIRPQSEIPKGCSA